MNALHYEIEVSRLTSFSARVVVRPGEDASPGSGVKDAIGEIRGPVCSLARTIPITTKLQWDHNENALVGEIVDPCDWSTRLPMQYQLKITRSDDDQPNQHIFGFRKLRTQGDSLFWDGRRWVPRGFYRKETKTDDLANLRSAGVTLVSTNPSDDLCFAASEQGVVLFAMLPADAAMAIEAVLRLRRHVSVAAMIIPEEFFAEEHGAANVRKPETLARDSGSLMKSLANASGYVKDSSSLLGPNETRPILLQEFSASKQEKPTHLMCDGFLLRLTGSDESVIDWPTFKQSSRPVVLFRASDEVDIAASRNACDLLQKETIQHGDFAGYLV